MANYVMVNINVDKEIFKQINDIMNTELQDSEGRIRFRMHKGSKQQFYREVIEAGLNLMIDKLDKKKKELECK